MVIEIPILRGGSGFVFIALNIYLGHRCSRCAETKVERYTFHIKKIRKKILSEKIFRAFWKLLREFQELISFVNFMGNHWQIMVFSHAAKSRELQKKIWEVKKSEINFKKSGHHNTSISAHLEHPSTYHICSGTL